MAIQKKTEQCVSVVFLLLIFSYMLCVSVFLLDNRAGLDNIRYIALFIGTVQGIFFMWNNKKMHKTNRKNNIGNQVVLVVFVTVIFFLLSVIQANIAGRMIGQRTWIQLALILLPALYAYCLVNLVKKTTFMYLCNIVLFMAVVFYMYEVGFAKFLSFNSWRQISFSRSYSPFENSNYSGFFLYLFLTFTYFRYVNQTVEKKEFVVIAYWISAFFTILCFKRLSVLFTIFMLIFPRVVCVRKKLPNWVFTTTSIVFIIGTILYSEIMKGNIFTNINIYRFSTGRSYILSLWKPFNYMSYGYGSSYEIIHRYLELDLVQIYLELGMLGIITISYCYFKIINKNIFSYLVMFYAFINMLGSSSIPSFCSWIFAWIILFFSTELIEQKRKYVIRFR